MKIIYIYTELSHCISNFITRQTQLHPYVFLYFAVRFGFTFSRRLQSWAQAEQCWRKVQRLRVRWF